MGNFQKAYEIINQFGSKIISLHNNKKEIEFFGELTKDSYADISAYNTFLVFESFDKIFYLIYANKNNSIIYYNLIHFEKISEIKKAHNNNITSFRNYTDNMNKRDLIISLSYDDSNIKLWNIKNNECLLNIKNIYNNRGLIAAYIFNNNNQINIISSSNKIIKAFDLIGNQIKEINVYSDDKIFYIDNFSDKKTSKNYIIICTNFMIKSYDYNKNRLYHEYHNIKYSNNDFIINDKEIITKLIVPCSDSFIRIWDFHSAELLINIEIQKKNDGEYLERFCLWNNDYLFASYNNIHPNEETELRFINLSTGYALQHFKDHREKFLTLKKINHPKYGECLITQGDRNNQIKLYKFKN